MKHAKRFDMIEVDDDGIQACMEESPNGEYMLASDFDRGMAELRDEVEIRNIALKETEDVIFGLSNQIETLKSLAINLQHAVSSFTGDKSSYLYEAAKELADAVRVKN